MPPDIAPMLPTTGIPATVDGWAAEPKLDLAWAPPRRARRGGGFTRRGHDVTEAVAAARAVRDADLRLVRDGELVAAAAR
jgi:ATP-dependent DNA ligase